MPAEDAKQIKEVKGLLYTTEYEFRCEFPYKSRVIPT